MSKEKGKNKKMEQLQRKSINERQRRKTIVYGVCGGIIIAAILVVTTLWVSGGARRGTDEAVNRVSEFYLEELAGRRAQVVCEDLKNNFAYMENALGILEDSDLESQETL